VTIPSDHFLKGPRRAQQRHDAAVRIVVQHPQGQELGGVSVYADNLVEALNAAGFNAIAISSKLSTPLARIRAVYWSDIVHLSSHDLLMATSARLLGKQISLKYHWPFWLSAKRHYVPMSPHNRLVREVRYLWGSCNNGRNVYGLIRAYSRLTLRFVVRGLVPTLLACSEFTARSLDTRRSVIAVPNPFRFAAHAALAADVRMHGGFYFVGRLADDKGVDLIVKAAARLIASGAVPFRVTIIGEGPEREKLEALAADLGVSDIFDFKGRLPHPAMLDELRRGLALIYPARWEDPAPYPPLEAASLNLLTIAARVGGLPETSGPHALFFDPEDVDGLAECMKWVMEHPIETIERGTEAGEWARNRFDERHAVSALLAAILPT